MAILSYVCNCLTRSEFMKPNATPIERFEGWFIKPIEKLQELDNGDGGFAALMIAIPLYERYIVGKLKLAGRPMDDENKKEEIAVDLNLNDDKRKIFWDIFRIGFMHQAMPKAGKTGWVVSQKYGALPEFKMQGDRIYICVDPWKFAARVLSKFKEDPRLITASESFPLANVFLVPTSGLEGTAGDTLKDLP